MAAVARAVPHKSVRGAISPGRNSAGSVQAVWSRAFPTAQAGIFREMFSQCVRAVPVELLGYLRVPGIPEERRDPCPPSAGCASVYLCGDLRVPSPLGAPCAGARWGLAFPPQEMPACPRFPSLGNGSIPVSVLPVGTSHHVLAVQGMQKPNFYLWVPVHVGGTGASTGKSLARSGRVTRGPRAPGAPRRGAGGCRAQAKKVGRVFFCHIPTRSSSKKQTLLMEHMQAPEKEKLHNASAAGPEGSAEV